jgi:hypothetical protein
VANRAEQAGVVVTYSGLQRWVPSPYVGCKDSPRLEARTIVNIRSQLSKLEESVARLLDWSPEIGFAALFVLFSLYGDGNPVKLAYLVAVFIFSIIWHFIRSVQRTRDEQSVRVMRLSSPGIDLFDKPPIAHRMLSALLVALTIFWIVLNIVWFLSLGGAVGFAVNVYSATPSLPNLIVLMVTSSNLMRFINDQVKSLTEWCRAWLDKHKR